MQGLNKLQLIGNVGNDPELSYTQGGTAVLKLRIAVNERRKIRDEWTEMTEWFSVTIWHKRAEALARLLGKGAHIMVEGPMRRRQYEDRNGTQREVYELSADNVLLLGGARRQPAQQGEQEQSDTQSGDDDIPF